MSRPTAARALRGRGGQTPLGPFDRGTMTKYLWPFMLILIIPVALVVGADQAKNEVKALRYFESINISNANVKQCVWFAMKEYNKGSEDKYVFLVDRTLHAKLQITDRMEYQINVQIARSNCKKPLNNTVNCITQKNPKLEKKVNCSFLVGALPWNGVFTLLDKDCKDI